MFKLKKRNPMDVQLNKTENTIQENVSFPLDSRGFLTHDK